MLNAMLKKLQESAFSVLPVTAIVVILNFTPLINLSPLELVTFLVSAVFLIIGISMFNLGADLAMTPMGEHIGSGLTKTGKIGFLLFVAFLMGLLITIAEPDITVLANQVAAVINETVLIFSVGAGVGLFLLLSIMKMIFKKQLSSLLLFFYMMLFAVAAIVISNGNESFLPLAFDSGGVTTGPITVPFLMALGVGIAGTMGGRNVEENSFGVIAMCSVGPILAVMLLGIGIDGDSIKYELPDYNVESYLGSNFWGLFGRITEEVLIAIGLIVAFFIILQIFCLKLPKKRLIRIAIGIIYTLAGLVIFLTAVNVGFMPVGYKIGSQLAAFEKPYILAIFGFILGMVVVLAEPAVHVLKGQVEDITDGMVSKTSMMIALSIGVGISICLAMLRTWFEFSILYYIIPGYLISLGLSFFVPGIYTAIAFDSGGVASGPLTSGFILPLSIGVCYALHGESEILSLGFGIVAMVAMTPLITIQLLGFRAVVSDRMRQRIAMKRILEADDEQIISFM